MRISVIGCGYLGATHAAGMAELGHEVIGVEVEPAKLELLRQGQSPVYEPELGDLLSKHVASGRLRFSDSHREAGDFADVHFICVGTPQQRDTLGADMSYVDAAVTAMAPHLRPGALLVGKSTVPVGTAQRLVGLIDELAPEGVSADLAWNPEFLREGHAVQDTLRPDRLVFGIRSPDAEKLLREVYAAALEVGTPVVVTDFATAELVKTSANAFLATKISFINAVAELCSAAGADVSELADALGHDQRIGRKFLNAGVGFGGGCLPKDVRAFMHRAEELGAEDAVNLLHEVDAINFRRRHRVTAIVQTMVGELAASRVAVLGAAFKPSSDDVRDSPALFVASELQAAGAEVRVYDPAAMESARRIYPDLTYVDGIQSACDGVDAVVHLTEWPEFLRLLPTDLDDVVRHRRFLDGRNALDPEVWRAAGWEFRSMGLR